MTAKDKRPASMNRPASPFEKYLPILPVVYVPQKPSLLKRLRLYFLQRERRKAEERIARNSFHSDFYPYLDYFLGGYFHQDHSIYDDTIEDVIAAYKAEGNDRMCDLGIRVDIHRFLARHPIEKIN